MRALNPENVRLVAEKVKTCFFFELMSIRLRCFSAGT